MTTFDTSEDWLQLTWASAGGFTMSWDEVKERMKQVIWINVIHDEIGYETFLELQQGRQS